MTRNPTLLTIILNYKTPDMTLDAAAAALRGMDGLAGRLIIVDNASQDGSFEQISEQVTARGWANVEVLQSGHNGGFGAGNNFGILAGCAQEMPDYIYILNSDSFVDKGAISALVEALETRPEFGFAGSYIRGPNGEAHASAFQFPNILGEFEGAARFGPISRLLSKHIVSLGVPETTQKVDWLAGASLMMRTSVLHDIGLFDEAFFLYFEETDLCRRAALAGYPTLYVRESEVTHIGSVSTGMKTWTRMPKFWFDSRQYYFRKNHGRGFAFLANIAHVAGGILWRLRAWIQRKPQADPDHFLRDLITHSFSGKIEPSSISTPQLPIRPRHLGDVQ